MTSSVQRELNSFFSAVQEKDYSIHAVTKGALTQARAKLKPEAFLELSKVAVKDFYEGAPYHTWKNHRLLAVDGSTLNLPSHPSNRETFGDHPVGCKKNILRSMAKISICYDVLNLLTLDAKIDKFRIAESALLRQHLQNVDFKEGDILLLDRGYPSAALMCALHQNQIHFCMRMKDSWWKEVEKFQREEVESKTVVFELPEKDKENVKSLWNLSVSKVHCRLVSITLENGEKETLCTSLLNEEKYTIQDLKELYHYRWNIEEAFKLYKCRVGLEVFSGKTAIAVKQDFYAKVFMMTVCAALSFPIEKKVREEAALENRKYPRQVNRTNAIAFFRNSWIAIWIKKRQEQILKSLDEILLKTTDLIRKGRKFERKKLPQKPPAMTYKQL